MRLFNTMSRKKEEFVPLEEGKVRMYVCGPTVYNLIHIGNARPMIIFDTVRRYLEYKGYDVNYVSNFTDVDDKIIKKANEEGVSPEEISQRYIAECKKDMAGMNVKPATTHPLATQEIDGMIDICLLYTSKGHYDRVNDAVYELWTETENFDRETILGQAEKYRVCPFEMTLDLAIWMDGIVCDYNYVFDPNVCLKRFFGENIKGNYIFLIDEAHNLVERGREMYSAAISKEEMEDVRKFVRPYSSRLYRMLGKAIRQMDACLLYTSSMTMSIEE